MKPHEKAFDAYGESNPTVKFLKKCKLVKSDTRRDIIVEGVTVYRGGEFGYLSRGKGGWITSCLGMYELHYRKDNNWIVLKEIEDLDLKKEEPMKKEKAIEMSKEYCSQRVIETKAKKRKEALGAELKEVAIDKGKKVDGGTKVLNLGSHIVQAVFKPKYERQDDELKKICKEKKISKADVTTTVTGFDNQKITDLHDQGILNEKDMAKIFIETPSYSISVAEAKKKKAK